MILALLFLLASIGSDIEARGPSAIAPATTAKAQDRTSVTGLVDNGRYVGEISSLAVKFVSAMASASFTPVIINLSVVGGNLRFSFLFFEILLCYTHGRNELGFRKEAFMPRRRQDLQASVHSAIEKIQSLDHTPLMPIGEMLGHVINVSTAEEDPNAIEPILDHIISVLNRLPKLTQRFYFDAYLIQSISESWSQGMIKCSKMIIPSYRNSWAHEIVQMPYIGNKGELTNSTKFQTLDLIYIRNKYKNEQPNLLDYPWLFHEMGHYLLARHGRLLLESFLPVIEELAKTLQLRALADRDVARIRARDTINEIRELWSPASGFSRWAHEIAIDAIGLWSCGPAYLESFRADHEDADPFVVGIDHPPVVIRTYTLIEAAKKLGWLEFAKPLSSALKALEKNVPDSEHNRYKTLRDKGLIDTYLNKIYEYYSNLGIPRLAIDDIERISRQEVDVDSQTLATELIVKAWLVQQAEDDVAYHVWEENIVNGITQLVIQ